MENASTRSYSSSLSLITSEVITGIDDIKQDVVSPKSPAKGGNVGGPALRPGPRLASLTELLLRNQKAAPNKWNSTSPDSPPSAGCFSTSPSSSPDQSPSPVVRTTSQSDEEDPATEVRRARSSGGSRRRRTPVLAGVVLPSSSSTDPSPSSGVVEADLRRFVFRHSRAERLVSGLRVHAFTRQAFVSSFAVGLALGSVVAIVLKILRDLTHRILYR